MALCGRHGASSREACRVNQDYQQAWAFVSTIAGDPNTAVVDFRALSDFDKGDKGYARRDTLPNVWPWLCDMNAAGYGIFAVIASLDGQGLKLANVAWLRAVYVDLDNASAMQNFQRTQGHNPQPAFTVASSPNKAHVYWTMHPFFGNERFEVIQRKLRQLYDGDRAVIDATRVMRMPGTFNWKYAHPQSPKYDGSEPHLVTCQALAGYGQYHDVEALEASVEHVNIIDGAGGQRKPLGDPEMQAPSLAWIDEAFGELDPNDMTRLEWLSISAALKQAAWSHCTPDIIYAKWQAWCALYSGNDIAENDKLWATIEATETGWQTVLNRCPGIKARSMFAGRQSQMMPETKPGAAHFNAALPVQLPDTGMPNMDPPPLDCSGEFLTHFEQEQWFKGVTYVNTLGEMLTPEGRFLNTSKFNARYGGKKFFIDGNGKVTDEAWKAATRSTLWRVPQVDHIRFLPDQPHGAIIADDLGRDGVNIYKPIQIRRTAGDPTPFLMHLSLMLPNVGDQAVLLDYLAHNAKFPGHKIPWGILIQSTEGAGKNVFKKVMKHAMGKPYCYFPKASELAESGAKFNAWLRHRLFILVDEIRVDEKRELIEILKDLISEEETEIQRKGIDQDLEDNFSNWLFFSNWKDAIPVDKNGRRYAIMYSVLQTYDDLLRVGMNETYFNNLYAWLDGGGAAIVTDYLLSRPIERGAIPMRAPATSSSDEAARISISPIQRAITEAVEDQIAGFRGGWLSSISIAKRVREVGAARGNISPPLIGSIVEKMGYVSCGRGARGYFQETSTAQPERGYLWYLGYAADVNAFGPAQGWS